MYWDTMSHISNCQNLEVWEHTINEAVEEQPPLYIDNVYFLWHNFFWHINPTSENL